MSNPKVSVVMSVFNGERFLREAVASILGQSFRDFEFIIINDGSTDGTGAMLDSYARSDPRVRVYHQENKGLTESLNRACGLAQGQYIARMDGDDVSTPDRLGRQIGFLEHHDKVGLLGGAVEEIDDQGRRVSLWRPPLENESIRAALHSFSLPISHPAVMMRKQAFDAMGGYRAPFLLAQDYDLWLRIVEDWEAANLSDVVVRKRTHSKMLSFCHRRQQKLAALAALALWSARQLPSVEPAGQEQAISEGYLRTLQTYYACLIQSRLRTPQDDAILRVEQELMDRSRTGSINNSSVAYAMLSAARIHFRRGKIGRALLSLGRALLTRPRIAGRPFKRAVNSLLRKLRFAQ
jgi:hypothetical protein